MALVKGGVHSLTETQLKTCAYTYGAYIKLSLTSTTTKKNYSTISLGIRKAQVFALHYFNICSRVFHSLSFKSNVQSWSERTTLKALLIILVALILNFYYYPICNILNASLLWSTIIIKRLWSKTSLQKRKLLFIFFTIKNNLWKMM